MIRKLFIGGAATAVAVLAILLMSVGGPSTAYADVNTVTPIGPVAPGGQVVVTIDADEGDGDLTVSVPAGTLTVDGGLTLTSCAENPPVAPLVPEPCVGETPVMVPFTTAASVTIPDLLNNLDTVTLTYTAPANGPVNVVVTATQGGTTRTGSIQVTGEAARVELNIIEAAPGTATITNCLTFSDPADVIAATNFQFTGDSATALASGTLCAVAFDAFGNRLPNETISFATTAGTITGTVDATRFNGNAATSSTISAGTTGTAGTQATVTAVALSSGVSATDTVRFGGNPVSCTLTASNLTIAANGGTSVLSSRLSDAPLMTVAGSTALTADVNRPVPDNTTVNIELATAGMSTANANLVGSPRQTENGVTAATTLISTGAAGDIIVVAVSAWGPSPNQAICPDAPSGGLRINAEGPAAGTAAIGAVCLPAPAGTGTIAGGTRPPAAGGFGLFVFCGGTYAQLESAACGTSATDAYWVTNTTGGFVQFVPQTTVTVVNAGFQAMFPGGVIPSGTPVIGKCV